MVSGSGNALESLGINKASLASSPRATVFSDNGLADRPSAKKLDGDSGFSRGWLAMSWRSE
jgi:hypothetical protein